MQIFDKKYLDIPFFYCNFAGELNFMRYEKNTLFAVCEHAVGVLPA